ncbi:MAG: hypothetical protein O3C21_09985 [Verrucomicrobia bacterium]|nr:hypothetical protein [Verrucomicrobiota bacterium]
MTDENNRLSWYRHADRLRLRSLLIVLALDIGLNEWIVSLAMKTQYLHRGFRAFVVLLACIAAPDLRAQSDVTAYRLVRGSALVKTSIGAGGEEKRNVPIAGEMTLRRVLSPLDFETYAVEGAVFREAGASSPPLLAGSGHYIRGGRGPIVRRLVFEAEVEGARVAFDSGSLPDDERWPRLDIEAVGKVVSEGVGEGGEGEATWTLRLAAVPVLRAWHYTLVEGSTLLDDCEVCGGLRFPIPMEGSFELVLTDENPLFSRYRLFDLDLRAPRGGPTYRITGEGDYKVGGEVAILQETTLDVEVSVTDRPVRTTMFEGGSFAPPRAWPMLSLGSSDVQGTPFSRITLVVNAAPFRDLWFSTAGGLTPGTPQLGEHYSGADVLSIGGHAMRRAKDAFAAFEFPVAGGFEAMDALDVAPGGELLFSLGHPAFSTSLGQEVQEGDLLAESGKVAAKNQALVAAFGAMPPTPDVGLDAVQVLDSGEVLFSIREPLFSEKLGVALGKGDLLSDRGVVVKRNRDLLAAFRPAGATLDQGLDAFYVWPHGEVWFSVEEGFQTPVGSVGTVGYGDLLSDQGFVVRRNLDLVAAFSPLEDVADFGLDALFVVTDFTPPPTGLTPPALRVEGSVAVLDWSGDARAWQLEHSPDLRLPFAPLTPILPVRTWRHQAEKILPRAGFYRIHGW